MENIDIYFESILQVYNQIIDWEEKRENRSEPFKAKFTNFLMVISVILLILSIIPIIPFSFVFLGSRLSLDVMGFNLYQANISTYVIAWLIAIVITVLLLLFNIWLDRKINPPTKSEEEKAPQTLSPEQLTFIYIYQAFKELKVFFVSHIDQHIEKALASLKALQNARVNLRNEYEYELMHLPPEFRYIEMEKNINFRSSRFRSIKNRSSLSRQIILVREFLQTFEKYSWFNLDELTKARLQALISFQKKIIIRLRKREDLPSVLNVLENLSKYLYAFLPEHQTNMNQDDLNSLQSEGIKCLDTFAENTDKLIDYPPEQRPNKNLHIRKDMTFFKRIQLFYFSNTFFRFFVWLFLLLGITTSLFYLAILKFPGLDINVIISSVVVASITGATALSVFKTRPDKILQGYNNESFRSFEIETNENDEE